MTKVELPGNKMSSITNVSEDAVNAKSESTSLKSSDTKKAGPARTPELQCRNHCY